MTDITQPAKPEPHIQVQKVYLTDEERKRLCVKGDVSIPGATTQPAKPESKSFAKLYEKHAGGIAEQAAILEKELKGKP